MAKLNLDMLKKPARDERTFECETSAGSLSLRVRKIGVLDTVNWTSLGDDLYDRIQKEPILLHDEVVLASRSTCRVATGLVIAQRGAYEDCYTEEEFIKLMTEDAFAVMATEAFEWLQLEEDEPKKTGQ